MIDPIASPHRVPTLTTETLCSVIPPFLYRFSLGHSRNVAYFVAI